MKRKFQIVTFSVSQNNVSEFQLIGVFPTIEECEIKLERAFELSAAISRNELEQWQLHQQGHKGTRSGMTDAELNVLRDQLNSLDAREDMFRDQLRELGLFVDHFDIYSEYSIIPLFTKD